MQVAYNNQFGGFSLSNEAFGREEVIEPELSEYIKIDL